MSEKIAVQTFTKKEFLKVIEKIPVGNWDNNCSDDINVYDVYKSDTCIDLIDGGYDHIEEFKGYTIITAEEYLKEGGEAEFKVGDRVECIADGDGAKIGMLGTVKEASDQSCLAIEFDGYIDTGHTCYNYCKDSMGRWVKNTYLRKITKQTKTEKENKDMEIGKHFMVIFKEDAELAVKMTKRFGYQYSGDDRDLIALKRDKKDLLAIVKAEEDEAAKAKD
jgi:hypothetical protein